MFAVNVTKIYSHSEKLLANLIFDEYILKKKRPKYLTTEWTARNIFPVKSQIDSMNNWLPGRERYSVCVRTLSLS